MGIRFFCLSSIANGLAICMGIIMQIILPYFWVRYNGAVQKDWLAWAAGVKINLCISRVPVKLN